MRGVHRLPPHDPVPAPVAFFRPSTVFSPPAMCVLNTFFLIPLHRQTGLRPSNISFSSIRTV